MAFQKGDTIDSYTLESQLGGGGFAEVWRVKDKYSQILAMKIYAAQSGLDSYGRTMFQEEFEKTRNLRHLNVLHCIDIGEHEGRPYLTMPLGKSSLMVELRNRLLNRKQNGQPSDILFSEEELAQILADLADGLGYLQQCGIIHQDIKPDNILLLEENGASRYAIADFGVSTQLRTAILRQTQVLHKSSDNVAAGYASPEQLEGHITKKSDIFSLGVMLYELATGRLPFEEAGIPTGQAVRDGIALPELQGDYSQRFKKLVAACLEKEPRRRPDTAHLLTWSEGYLQQKFWSESVEKAGRPNLLRDWRVLAGAGLLLLLVAGFFGWRSMNSKKWKQNVANANTLFQAGEIKNAATALDKAIAFRSDSTLLKQKALLADLQTRYSAIGKFSEGLAPVRSGSGWGYINTSGAEVVAAAYEQAGPFVGGRAAVYDGKNCGYIDQTGDSGGTGGLIFKTCETPQGRSAKVQRTKNGANETITW